MKKQYIYHFVDNSTSKITHNLRLNEPLLPTTLAHIVSHAKSHEICQPIIYEADGLNPYLSITFINVTYN